MMSKEYVEREVISEGIRKYYYKNPPNSSYEEGFDHGLDKAQRVILNAPVADVVPAVRCQDCVYAHPLKDSKYDYLCHYWNGHSCNQNQFCSQGKRKEDEK